MTTDYPAGSGGAGVGGAGGGAEGVEAGVPTSRVGLIALPDDAGLVDSGFTLLVGDVWH